MGKKKNIVSFYFIAHDTWRFTVHTLMDPLSRVSSVGQKIQSHDAVYDITDSPNMMDKGNIKCTQCLSKFHLLCPVVEFQGRRCLVFTLVQTFPTSKTWINVVGLTLVHRLRILPHQVWQSDLWSDLDNRCALKRTGEVRATWLQVTLMSSCVGCLSWPGRKGSCTHSTYAWYQGVCR